MDRDKMAWLIPENDYRDLVKRLERLTLKWRAMANHPQRDRRPEERELLERCADDLFRVILGGGG